MNDLRIISGTKPFEDGIDSSRDKNIYRNPSWESLRDELIKRGGNELADQIKALSELNNISPQMRESLAYSAALKVLGKQLSQGDESASCAAAAIENGLALSDPKKYLTLLSELVRNGTTNDKKLSISKYHLPELFKISANGASLFREGRVTLPRSFTSSIMQIAILDAMNGEGFDIDISSSSLASDKNQNPESNILPNKISGVFDSWLESGIQTILGEGQLIYNDSDMATESIRKGLSLGEFNGKPCQIKVTSENNHVVLLEKVEKGELYFIDSQWHSSKSSNPPIAGAVGVGGHSWKISIDEALKFRTELGGSLINSVTSPHNFREKLTLENGDKSFAIAKEKLIQQPDLQILIINSSAYAAEIHQYGLFKSRHNTKNEKSDKQQNKNKWLDPDKPNKVTV